MGAKGDQGPKGDKGDPGLTPEQVDAMRAELAEELTGRLNAAEARLLERLRTDPMFRGPQGEQGSAGLAGPRGVMGPPAPEGGKPIAVSLAETYRPHRGAGPPTHRVRVEPWIFAGAEVPAEARIGDLWVDTEGQLDRPVLMVCVGVDPVEWSAV